MVSSRSLAAACWLAWRPRRRWRCFRGSLVYNNNCGLEWWLAKNIICCWTPLVLPLLYSPGWLVLLNWWQGWGALPLTSAVLR